MINGFNQNSGRLLLPIRNEGCAILSLLYEDKEAWTESQINELYRASIGITFKPKPELEPVVVLREDCYINSWEELMHLAGIEAWYVTGAHVPISTPMPEFGFEIVKWQYFNTFYQKTFKHFIVGNGTDRGIKWDPLGYSNTVRLGAPVDKLIFKWR
jgi:hypothetical protein